MQSRPRCLLVLAAMWLAAIHGCERNPATSTSKAAAAAAAPTTAPPVHVCAVETTSIAPSAEGTAALEAQRDAVLRAESAGRIKSLRFERGDNVAVGQVLLSLDVGRTQVALEASQATIAQAQAQLAQAQRERETAERLVAQGSMPSQALANALDAERIARAALNSATAQSQVTRHGLAEATLAAPFDGVVVERMAELGEYVTPGAPVARLVQAAPLRARVPLSPRDALDVKVGAPVQAALFARPDQTFSGVVLHVSAVVDPRTRKLPVEVQLDDPEQLLRPGLVARLSVQTGEPRAAVVVDENAIFERFHQSYAYVVEQGVAQRREVQLGDVYDGKVEVRSGLAAAELVVRAGLDRVVDGQTVQVIEEDTATQAEQP